MLIVAFFALGLLALQAGQPSTTSREKLSELLRRWPDEYVKWIMTEEERSRYRTLATDQERLDFIEWFWARRDPAPETAENEYRAEYLEQFAYVMNRFSAGKPGWATDRGRIYLLLGPPHSVQQNPMGRYSLERPSEIWTYNNLPIPGVPASLDIHFVDFKGTGDFEIVSDLESTAPVVMQFGTAESSLLALAMRRGRLGMEDPRTGFGRFREVDSTRLSMRELDLQQQLREIEQLPERNLRPLAEAIEARVSFERLSLRAATGALYTGEGKVKVPVSLAVPYHELSAERREGKLSYSIDYLIRLVGESAEAARTEDRLALSFNEEQQQKLSSHQLAIEESLEVTPGSYTLQAYLRDNLKDKVGTLELPLEALAPERGVLALSSLFLAGALAESAPGTSRPFQFGTVRVIPSLDRTFGTDQSLGLYLQAYGAARGANGKKRIKVDCFVMKEGRLFLGVPAIYLFPDSEPIGITASIPLRKCPPGAYTIRVRVTDEVAGRSAEQEAGFLVVAGPPPGQR